MPTVPVLRKEASRAREPWFDEGNIGYGLRSIVSQIRREYK
jgi:hypothetical protein